VAPKASKNVSTMLEDVFFRMIPISESGKRRAVTMVEAILLQLVIGAAKGDVRHIDRVLKLLPMEQEARAARLAGGDDVGQDDSRADLAVLEALADMFGSNPEQLFATLQGGTDDDRRYSILCKSVAKGPDIRRTDAVVRRSRTQRRRRA
jgi:hypothetical protein